MFIGSRQLFPYSYVHMIYRSIIPLDEVSKFEEKDHWIRFADNDLKNLEKSRMLLIGDSIAVQIHQPLSILLKDNFSLSLFATSTSVATPHFLSELEYAISRMNYDVIQFNNGLHGLAESEQAYRNGLIKSIELIKRLKPYAKIIWANTTSTKFNNEIIINRNKIATEVMTSLNVPIINLYSEVIGKDYLFSDGVHFNNKGVQIISKKIASFIRKQF